MTFDHQIDLEPATIGSAAMVLKAERQEVVRKLLVAQAFAASAGSTTARYTTAAQLSVRYEQHHGPTPTGRSAPARPQTTTQEDTCPS
jgi:hypothetical protein